MEKDATIEFRSSLLESPYARTTLDEGLEQHFGEYIYDYCDIFLIYNVTENTYNTVSTSGTVCEYIIVAYTANSKCVDFITFTK